MSWTKSCRVVLTLLLFLGAAAAAPARAVADATADESPGAEGETVGADEAAAADGAVAADDDADDGSGDSGAGGPEAGEEDERREPLTELVLVKAEPPYVPASNSILSKLPMELMKTPANVGVVGAPLIEEQDDLVLSDALRNVSGINVQPQSGVQDFFYLRGFDSVSGGLILIDGAMEPEASVYQMYNVERVEVFKGPAGFLYGPNPLSGAVNLVRKQPLPSRLWQVQVQGGSEGFAETTFDVNLPAGDGDNFQFRLNGLYRQADGFRDRELEDWAINPAFTWLWDDSSLTLNLEAAQVKRTPDGGLPLQFDFTGGTSIPPVDREQVYQSPFDFSEQDVGRLQVDWETRLNDKVRLRDKVYGRHLDWQTDATLLSGAFPLPIFDPNDPLFGNSLVIRNLTALDDKQNILGNQFEAIFELNAGSWKHDLLVGLEVSRHTDVFTLGVAPSCSSGVPAGFCLPDITLFNPVETATARPTTSQFDVGDSTTDIVAPYILDQIASDGRWSFLVGARLDLLDFSDATPGTSDFSGHEVSPMAGVVFAPTKSGSIYLNAGQAFAPPSPRSVDPKPETSSQVELGYRHLFLDNHLQTTFAVYHLQRENVGIPDGTGFIQQNGDQDSDGFEFELAYEGRRHLRAFVSYAYNDSVLTSFLEPSEPGFDCDGNFGSSAEPCDRSGNDPAFAPHHIANAWVSKKWEAGFGIGGGGRYVSRQYIAEDNAFSLDSYLVADGTVFYERPRYRVFLNLRNLTDKEYNVRAFPSNAVLPAPGLTVFAGVRFRN